MSYTLKAQDTFSIVALDTVTGEVGSAGASCVDMSNFPAYDDDFLGELFPALGAINTQAWYKPENQANARDRMNEGYTPEEIIAWLIDNDVENLPEKRQYGIVAFVADSVQSAGHTGIQTNDYKNHVLGPNYAIQGNILLGQEILDSMESRFINEPGDLACKLMAALQGANVVGADTRCAPNGTSALFAFVKVAQPDDTFGEPSFLVSVRTSQNAGIEPIDSLQVKFSMVHDCSGVGLEEEDSFEGHFLLYPNPGTGQFTVRELEFSNALYSLELSDIHGNLIDEKHFSRVHDIDISDFPDGVYFLMIRNSQTIYTTRLVKQ
jgi:uncharacterized Ntn-hydrolase superfamily protein